MIYAALGDWDPEDRPTGEQIGVILDTYEATCGRSVLVVGNPADGLACIGPVHPDDPEMLRYAEDHGSDWWLMPLTPLAAVIDAHAGAPAGGVRFRIVARFEPYAWMDGDEPDSGTISIDPQGPQEWDVTGRFVTLPAQHRAALTAALDQTGEASGDDHFKDDPAAPEWVREHSGPFEIILRRADRLW